MSSSFSELKKSKKNLDKLVAEASKLTGQQNNDERMWYPGTDKAGNGYAKIRFLPAPKGEELPWVRYFAHGFKSEENGSWLIENCPTTLGQTCPVCDFNNKLWNSVTDDKAPERDQARNQKRNQTYVTNIYVIEDNSNPDNNGKVFLFKFGPKIWNKIHSAMVPPEAFKDEEPLDPFDFWEGANFKIKISQVAGYRNYDKSEFESPSQLLDDDEALKEIWEKEYSLQEFLDPKNFKSQDELKDRLQKVLFGEVSSKPTSKKTDNPVKEKKEEEDTPPWEDKEEEKPAPKKKSTADFAKKSEEVKETKKPKEEPKKEESSDEDEDDEFFKKLMADD